MPNTYNLEITSGKPVKKEIVASLPSGRIWWTDISQFETRMQIREKPSMDATLVLDLTPYLIVTMPSANVINIKFAMTGTDTRKILRGGYFDLIVSDPGTLDARVHQLVKGRVTRRTLTTSETSLV